MMLNVDIYNYKEERKTVRVNTNTLDFLEIQIVAGDEVLYIHNMDGTVKVEDSYEGMRQFIPEGMYILWSNTINLLSKEEFVTCRNPYDRLFIAEMFHGRSKAI